MNSPVLHETDAQRFSALRGCGLLALKFLKIPKLWLSTNVLKRHWTRNLAKRLLQEAFYLSALNSLRFVFSVLLVNIIFFRFVIRVLLFIISFCRFNVRICGYVYSSCRFVIINLLCIIRYCRFDNRICRFIIWFLLFVIIVLPYVIVNLSLIIKILLWLFIKNRKNQTKGR